MLCKMVKFEGRLTDIKSACDGDDEVGETEKNCKITGETSLL